jgi:hypothetical protein
MTSPQTLRDNDVERLSDGFTWRKAENALRAHIPKEDATAWVCVNNRVGRVSDEYEMQAVNVLSYHRSLVVEAPSFGSANSNREPPNVVYGPDSAGNVRSTEAKSCFKQPIIPTKC